jgi:transposase
MMGILQPKQPSLFAYDVNLELRIPSDHPLRVIKRTLDLSFVDRLVEKTYGRSGNQSIPPQILMRMLFLLFYYNIPSERELSEQIAVRLDFLWFLDLDLESPVPNHSVLSKARARWGGEIFQQLFVRTVEQCVEAGLVEGKLLHIDSTIVAANASRDSVFKSSPELITALRRACQDQEQKLEVIPSVPQESAGEAQLPLAAAPAPERPPAILTVLEPAASLPEAPAHAEPAPEPPASAFEPRIVPASSQPADEKVASAPPGELATRIKNAPVNETHLSRTDPDAELARDKSGVTRLCYKEHRFVDDACGVITAVKVTGSTAADGVQLPALYTEHQSHTGLPVLKPIIAGDKHYGTAGNYRYCVASGIRPHLGEAVNGVAGRGLFSPKQFLYEPEHDQFRCPAGHPLVLHQRRPEIQCNTYLIERAELCADCPLRTQCTKSKRGRSLQVAQDYGVIEAARAEAHSPAARYSRRRRRHVMEGSFADAMNNHGAKRARWRRLKRQEMQSWMIAAVQNIRILLQHAGKPSAAEAPVSVIDANERAKSAELPPKRSRNALFGSQRQCLPWHELIHQWTPPPLQPRWPMSDATCPRINSSKSSWATRPHVVSYKLE